MNSELVFSGNTVELIDYMGDDARACHAARVSLLNDDMAADAETLSEKDERLIKFLLREKHTSPFEHSFVTFRVYASLPVIAQILRHRTLSFNQASRRYTAEDIEFFSVSEWRKQGEKNLQCSDGELPLEVGQLLDAAYKTHCLDSLKIYEWALEQGCSREQARFFLPQGLMARMYVSGNLLNFLKFLSLRDSDHAQPECREIAVAMRKDLERVFPKTMQLFAVQQ